MTHQDVESGWKGSWVFLCRPSFETVTGKEASRALETAEPFSKGKGWVRVHTEEGFKSNPALSVRKLVFARQLFYVIDEFEVGPANLDPSILLKLLSKYTKELPWLLKKKTLAAIHAETPDTESGKELWPHRGKVEESVARTLARKGWKVRPNAIAPKLHLFFPTEEKLVIGLSPTGAGSGWAMGIPRLAFPGSPPSRSARKLEEAFHFFVPQNEWDKRLRAGMRAVDLGAAPGGWSWRLAERGLLVTSVDKGAMDPKLMATGLVSHREEDGFLYKPDIPAHWLVCDMVAPPARIAKLIGIWGGRGLMREAIFNLKLPQGSPAENLSKWEKIIERELNRVSVSFSLRFKHLYHDRSEVTGHLVLKSKPAKKTSEQVPQRRPPPSGRRSGRGRSSTRLKTRQK